MTTEPGQEQLALPFQDFIAARTSTTSSQLAEVYDLAPRFAFSTIVAKAPTIRYIAFRVGNTDMKLEITAGASRRFVRARGGNRKLDAEGNPIQGEPEVVFPGPREELVESALRKMILDGQGRSHVRIREAPNGDTQISVDTRLSAICTEINRCGHSLRTHDVLESLMIMAEAKLTFVGTGSDQSTRMDKREMLGFRFIGDRDDGYVRIDFHPELCRAIMTGRYYEYPYERAMGMNNSLSRWIVKLMTLRYRQARADDYLNGEGYFLYMGVFFRAGWKPYASRAHNIREVRQALQVLVENDFLACKPGTKQPWINEEVIYEDRAPGQRGRRQIKDCMWTLAPSPRFADEIFSGNVVRSKRANLPAK